MARQQYGGLTAGGPAASAGLSIYPLAGGSSASLGLTPPLGSSLGAYGLLDGPSQVNNSACAFVALGANGTFGAGPPGGLTGGVPSSVLGAPGIGFGSTGSTYAPFSHTGADSKYVQNFFSNQTVAAWTDSNSRR